MNEILSQELLNEVKNETEKMRQLRYELQARIKNFLEEWKSATNYEFNIVKYDDIELFRVSYECDYCVIERNRNKIYLRKLAHDDFEYETIDIEKLNFESTLKIAQSIIDAVRKHIEFLKSKNQEYEKLLQVYEKFQVVNNEEVKA